MSDGVIRSNKPLVLVCSRADAPLHADLSGLACSDFDVEHCKEMEDLQVALDGDRNVTGVVIAQSVTDEDCTKVVSYIGAQEVDNDLPVFVHGDPRDTTAQAHTGDNKVRTLSTGLVVTELRSLIAQDIESFTLVRNLRRELQRKTEAFGQIIEGTFRLQSHEECQHLATMLSANCDNPVAVAIGLAELLINGVEHGCLNITHEQKGALIEKGVFLEEIARRSKHIEYQDRAVLLKYARTEGEMTFHITDPGEGFDYQSYIERSADLTAKHGRGITMAHACFTKVEYFGKGNEVKATYIFQGTDA